MTEQELLGQLVALLFVSSEPQQLGALARALELSPGRLEPLVRQLEQSPPPGLILQRHGEALQLATAPAAAPYVRRLLGLPETTRLSRAGLEVLALVAYRQPVTRAEIDAIRGVESDRAVATLLSRGLIEEVGHREGPGRPSTLGTSVRFLEHLGLRSLAELPPFPVEPVP
jgi:segregation and condensation protein B